jgi:hypothetical protein
MNEHDGKWASEVLKKLSWALRIQVGTALWVCAQKHGIPEAHASTIKTISLSRRCEQF